MKFEVYVYKLCSCVSRIGIRFVYELFIYVYWSKLVSSPVADTAIIPAKWQILLITHFHSFYWLVQW